MTNLPLVQEGKKVSSDFFGCSVSQLHNQDPLDFSLSYVSGPQEYCDCRQGKFHGYHAKSTWDI